MDSLPQPSLTLVIDRRLYRPRPSETPDERVSPLSLVEAAIAGGVNIVQLRVRSAAEGDLGVFAVAMRLRELTAGRAQFVVTGDVELAEKCRADGVLLPERSYRPSEARAFLRGETTKMVGAFARNVLAASRAERGGADYVQVGPIFDDAEDDGLEGGESGLLLLRKVKDAVQIPVVAFGGIRTAAQVADCLGAGADGIAVTDAVTAAPDPQTAAAALRAAMDAVWRALRSR